MCLICFEQNNFKNGLFIGPGNIFDKDSNPDFTNEELEMFLTKHPDKTVNISYFNPMPSEDDNYNHKAFSMCPSKINSLNLQFKNLISKHDSVCDFLENYKGENFEYIFAKRVFHRLEKEEILKIINFINTKSTENRLLEIIVHHTEDLKENNLKVLNLFINKIKGNVKIIFYK